MALFIVADISGGLLRLRAFPHGANITTDLEVKTHISTRPLTTNGHILVSAQNLRTSHIPHVSDVHIALNDSSTPVGMFRASYHEGDTLGANVGLAGTGSSLTGSSLSSEKPLEPSAPPFDDEGSLSGLEHHKTLPVLLNNGMLSSNHTSPTSVALQSSTRLLHPYNDNSSGSSSCTQTCYGGTANSCGVMNGDQGSDHSGDCEVIDFVSYNTTNVVGATGNVSNGDTSGTAGYTGPPSTSGETYTGTVGPPPTYEEALNHHRRESCPKSYEGTSRLRGLSESDSRVSVQIGENTENYILLNCTST